MNLSKIMGVDPGSKRIGIALADTITKISLPHSCIMIDENSDPIAELAAIVEREQVERIIVGKPILMDGSAGIMAQHAERFALELEQRTQTAVVLWDERLTSQQAERLYQTDRGRKQQKSKRRKHGDIDAMAATIILESYLNSQLTPQ